MYRGYTLIELVVVIAIVGLISLIGFYGLKPENDAEKLDGAQREFLANFRAAQNNVMAGRNSGATYTLTFNSGGYDINDGLSTKSYNFPAGVTWTAVPGYAICLVNPNKTVLTNCAACSVGAPATWSSFSCPAAPVSGMMAMTISGRAGAAKTITVEGSGIFINRIYGQ